jgi:hypothetical protein
MPTAPQTLAEPMLSRRFRLTDKFLQGVVTVTFE